MEELQHSHDGIDNYEHILDMRKQLDMLFNNIKDNTDTAFEILKMHENDTEQDVVDVYRINCSDILDCEKLVEAKVNSFKELSNALAGKGKEEIVKVLPKLEDLFDEIRQFEKSSTDLLYTLMKKINK